MPETPPVAPNPESMIAGKYETPEAFDKGFREIAGKIGIEIPADTPIIAKDGKGLFASQDAAVTGYKGYETALGKITAAAKPAAPATPTKPGEDPLIVKAPEPEAEEGDEPIAAIVNRAGLKSEEVVEQWKEKGELTADQYKAFGKVGIGRELVDHFMKGQEAIATMSLQRQEAAVAAAEKIVGGKPQLETLRDWASKNIKPDELNRLAAIIDPKRGGSRDNYPEYVEMLAARHAKAVGSGGAQPLVQGGAAPTGAGVPKNRGEFVQLMNKVNEGDAAASAVLASMSTEQINSFGG